ncbi:hypothetical protein C7M18_02684 [Bacillus velezensis]|nr:hypothetical protein C7M18_02684 [Bacillus velezensis]
MHTKIGGQPGSKNALGNSGGGSGKKPNAVSHGFFSKYLPEEILSIKEIQGCFQLNFQLIS